MRISLLLIICALTSNSYADTFVKYGLGIFNSALDEPIEVKTLSVGRQMHINEYLIWQYEVGGWIDNRSDMGRDGSAFADLAIGLNVDAGPFYAQTLTGVAGLSNIDSYLGGHAQFNHDVAVGFKAKSGASLGLNYKHISSAGIFEPNYGRDFLTIRLGLPF